MVAKCVDGIQNGFETTRKLVKQFVYTWNITSCQWVPRDMVSCLFHINSICISDVLVFFEVISWQAMACTLRQCQITWRPPDFVSQHNIKVNININQTYFDAQRRRPSMCVLNVTILLSKICNRYIIIFKFSKAQIGCCHRQWICKLYRIHDYMAHNNKVYKSVIMNMVPTQCHHNVFWDQITVDANCRLWLMTVVTQLK